MQRVLIENEPADAEVATKATNGYRATVEPAADNGVEDIRRACSKRDNRQHKPRRTRTAFTRRLGPYSRFHAIAEIDQRTKEAQLMRRVRDELTAHVGGRPSAVERLLIERATMLSLRVAQIDIKIMAGEVLTLHDNQHALSWNNALRRTLSELGLEPRNQPVVKEADLGDWVQSKSRVA
jgi:hypothetical protein